VFITVLLPLLPAILQDWICNIRMSQSIFVSFSPHFRKMNHSVSTSGFLNAKISSVAANVIHLHINSEHAIIEWSYKKFTKKNMLKMNEVTGSLQKKGRYYQKLHCTIMSIKLDKKQYGHISTTTTTAFFLVWNYGNIVIL